VLTTLVVCLSARGVGLFEDIYGGWGLPRGEGLGMGGESGGESA